MCKQLVDIKVNDNYGFLDEICNLFAINQLTRADFTADELQKLVDVFVPLIIRNTNSNLKWNYKNDHEQYLKDIKKYETYKEPVCDWIIK